MSREILFKAKRKNDGEWVEGYYCKINETTYCVKEEPVPTHHYILQETMTDWGLPNRFLQFEIDPDTNCQYTGGRDKYHTKIWENDICKVNTQNIDEEDGYFVVQWDAETLRFVLTGNGLVFDFDNLRMEQVEVVGNIFDNPELLEVN